VNLEPGASGFQSPVLMYLQHETFSFMKSFGDRFWVSRKGGTGGGGWVHLKGANSMAVSGLACRKDLALEGSFLFFWA